MYSTMAMCPGVMKLAVVLSNCVLALTLFSVFFSLLHKHANGKTE